MKANLENKIINPKNRSLNFFFFRSMGQKNKNFKSEKIPESVNAFC